MGSRSKASAQVVPASSSPAGLAYERSIFTATRDRPSSLASAVAQATQVEDAVLLPTMTSRHSAPASSRLMAALIRPASTLLM